MNKTYFILLALFLLNSCKNHKYSEKIFLPSESIYSDNFFVVKGIFPSKETEPKNKNEIFLLNHWLIKDQKSQFSKKLLPNLQYQEIKVPLNSELIFKKVKN